jgi:hypothetical protein
MQPAAPRVPEGATATRKTVLASPLVVVALAIAFQVFSDLKSLRSDVRYINYALSDINRVLDQNPDGDEIQSIRLRLDQVLNDLRRLSLDHQAARTFFPHEIDSTYEYFGEVRKKYEAMDRPL